VRDDSSVVSKKIEQLSPWVKLETKQVRMGGQNDLQVYHSIGQADYISILAVTEDGRIPIVRQFRPAVEVYTWELPAGLVEEGEAPSDTCRRELLEETGLIAKDVVPLGVWFPDTGRLGNRLHAFFVHASNPDPKFIPESGMSLEFTTSAKLKDSIRAGEFQHLLHVSLLALAELHGLILNG
jgi:ADP-ribose pyrophosphatase